MDSDRHVFIVDDDPVARGYICSLLEAAHFKVHSFSSAKRFLDEHHVQHGCVIAKICMPDMTGLELQEEIVRRHMEFAVIIVTGRGNVLLAVRAMKAGAIDFLEKPFDDEAVLASVQQALLVEAGVHACNTKTQAARDSIALLTPREQVVLTCLIKGRTNKIAGYELSISPRTVEIHRGRIMHKMKVSSMSDLVRVALAAEADMVASSGVKPQRYDDPLVQSLRAPAT